MNYFPHLREEDIQVGTVPKEVIYQEDKITLYRFVAPAEHSLHIPVLIVYALVNRPYSVDLQTDRSLVANLLKLGLDVYLIDWGYATRADRWLTLNDYINGYLDTCVDVLCDRLSVDQINLLGICQGGTFSLCYSALHPEKVNTLITMVTPVDFHVPEGLLNLFGGATLGKTAFDVDLLVDTLGNVPGEFLNLEFLMLKPFQLGVEKYANLPAIAAQKDKLLNFLRMEKWIFDSPDQPGEVYRQFVKDFYQGNKLIQGLVELDGQRVNLQNIRLPVLNIYAEHDHLVPPQSSIVLGQYVGSEDYTVRSFPTGHIGIYVSSKVQEKMTLVPGGLEATLSSLRAQLSLFGQHIVLLDDLPQLQMPTLVVWGNDDLIFPKHQAEIAVKRIPKGELVLIPDAGHIPQLEQPNRFVAALEAFLSKIW